MYHDNVEGIKIIRPEIEYSHKQYRQWNKDKRDIELLNQYRKTADDWNDELVVEDYTPSIRRLIQRGILSLRQDGLFETIEHGIELTRRHGPYSRQSQNKYDTKPMSVPARAVQSYRQAGLQKTIQRGIRLVKIADPTGMLQRYSKPRHKIKLATLAENKLTLQYPAAELLNAQYQNEEFERYDLLVYLSAIKAHRDGHKGSIDLYETFAENTDAPPINQFLMTVEDYFENQRGLPVPIGYNSQILDGTLAACAFYEGAERINVTVQSSNRTQERYPLEWFSTRNFTKEELNHLQTEFGILLARTGTLFEVILWPPVSEYFEEILETLQEEESLHSCTHLIFDRETFGEFVHDLYATQTDVRWDYIEEKISKIEEDPSEVLSIQIEVPSPRIRERNSHEMKEIKEKYRARYNPQIAPDDPNTRRVIHAADDYAHNRKTREIIENYKENALNVEKIVKIGDTSKWRSP